MTEPIDFYAKLAAKRNESSYLCFSVDMKLEADRRLAAVIDDMRSELGFENKEVVVLLRQAIDVLEGRGEE